MPRTWDYLVVGAGMAGGLMAAGLAAGGRSTVLVLDVGSTRHGPIPAVRPHVLEFDEWARTGADGWAPEDVLPHFRELEADLDVGRLRGHGTDGPVPVRRTPEEHWTPADRAFRLAALHRGHPWAPDHNAAGTLGVSPRAMVATHGGPVSERCLVRRLVEGLDTVSVRTVTGVERILWDGARAVGVEVAHGGRRECLEAGETVLCAGGVESPLVLQRSGVGPPDVLRAAGIEPRVEAPVGQGVQTHALVEVVGHGSLVGPRPETPSFGMLARWNTGLEGATSGDLMAWTDPATSGGVALRMTGTVAQPLSRGSLGITGPHAGAPPALDPRILTHDLDGYRMRLVAQHLFDLAAGQGLTPAVVPLDGGAPALGLPDAGEEIRHWARRAVRPAPYVTSGCRMGATGDPLAVVDPSGRVKGTESLYAADESIMPSVVKADPWLTSVAVAARAAGLHAAQTGIASL